MEDVYTFTINGELNLNDEIICFTNIRHLFINAKHCRKKYSDKFTFYKLTSDNISPYTNLSYKKICRNPSNVEELLNHYDKKSNYK